MPVKTAAQIAAVVLLAGCQPSSSSKSSPTPKQQIRLAISDWENAFERRDLAGVMSLYVPGKALIVYGPPPPAASYGHDTLRAEYERFFARFDGPLESELDDLQIVASETIGFGHGIQSITGRLKDGSAFRYSLRFSQGYRKVNGRWIVLHEHLSSAN